MVYHTRLLGVFVPSNRHIPTAKERNVHAVPVVDAPPFSEQRWNELNGSMAHYETLSDDDLKALLREQGIGLRGRRTRAHWIKALDGHVVAQDRKTYEAWQAQAVSQIQIQRTPYVPPPPSSEEREQTRYHASVAELGKRQHLMFASQYQANARRKSFLVLPPEIRNQIYSLALFSEKGVFEDMKIYYCPSKDILISHRRQCHARPIAEEIMISVLDMLGAMNKQIRREIRGFFYSHMPLRVQGSWQDKMDMHTVIHHFLKKIGSEGRASLPELNVIPYGGWSLDYGLDGANKFNIMLDSIALCHNITYFSLELAVSHIVSPDIKYLKAHFLHSNPLVSPSLDAFADTLASMESLRHIHIRMRPMPPHDGAQHHHTEHEAFLRFAFSGVRELVLWAAFDDCVQGNDVFDNSDGVTRKLAHVSVWTSMYPAQKLREGGDEMVDYTAWLEWCKEEQR
ncbi:hypothetical protein DE146DRAFT_753649 [Phaeosphaeria sp. MPI-PUGE-AT-0046c]|nr:hypothetical protein DE146DRAFT_753649 [Phaeosphaeria sp. MPI-PUGE-AT-0046c]